MSTGIVCIYVRLNSYSYSYIAAAHRPGWDIPVAASPRTAAPVGDYTGTGLAEPGVWTLCLVARRSEGGNRRLRRRRRGMCFNSRNIKVNKHS